MAETKMGGYYGYWVKSDPKHYSSLESTAPPQGDDETFFNDELFPILRNKTYDHVIMGGDFNVGMENHDYKGYADP